MDDLHIEDGSNDKAYFTMVPNIVLNHSSAVDQALYMQMKRFAGEKNGGGYCTASKRTLKEKLKIGYDALNKSIEYLVGHGWISYAGTRKVMTDGGAQDIQIFRVNDIWKMNTEHYKGAPESDPLSKVLPKPDKVLLKSSKVLLKHEPLRTNKTIEPSESLRAREYEIVSSIERKEKTSTKYPHAREVFEWFPHPQPSWQINNTELKHAELLFERGEKKVRGALAFLQDHEGDEYMPQITKPSDLERKWLDLVKYADKV